MSKTICIAGQKGGLGRSTITRHLSYCLSLLDGSVLTVDLDPQGSLSTISGADMALATIADVLGAVEPGEVTLSGVIQPLTDNLHIASADTSLALTESALVLRRAREYQLQRALESVKDNYKWILIDNSPALSNLVINSLIASDYVLVPVKLDMMSVDGLSLFLRTLADTQADYPDCAQILGVVVNEADTRTVLAREMLERLRKRDDLMLFESLIPATVRFKEAALLKLPITTYAPNTRASEAIEQLALEVIERGK